MRRRKNTFTSSLTPQIVTALFLVLIASLLVAGLFLGAFIWSVRSDQFEDQRGNSMRMLYDDELVLTRKK